MLPYTPLHHLLLRDAGRPLVMTSGNLSEEPIAKDNDEALRAAGAASPTTSWCTTATSTARYDDSVMHGGRTAIRAVRPAARRGLCPLPGPPAVRRRGQSWPAAPRMKNTFCLTRDDYAFVSQHIGDMENLETLEHFETTIELYRKLFRIEPEIIAYDMHPEYLPTKYAQDLAGQREGSEPRRRCSTTTPTSPAAWRTTACRGRSSGWPSTAPATARTAPSGAASSWWPTIAGLPPGGAPGVPAPARRRGGHQEALPHGPRLPLRPSGRGRPAQRAAACWAI